MELPKDKKIILFDGVCTLCNNLVIKIIKYDKKDQFVFASLQSEIGKKITKHINISNLNIDSVILYEPNISYDVKSTAVLKIMNSFGGFWKVTQLFFVLPESVRNLAYDFIAKNRYKWFGKKEICMTPTEELRKKFLV